MDENFGLGKTLNVSGTSSDAITALEDEEEDMSVCT